MDDPLPPLPLHPKQPKKPAKPPGYDVKKEARGMLKSGLDALRLEIANGKGVARVQAVALLAKLAEADRPDVSEMQIDVNLIPIAYIDDDGKIVPLREKTA